MLKAGKTRAEIYRGNTIEYDVKSSQVKATMVKCTKIQAKGLTAKISHKKRWHCKRVCDAMKPSYIKIDH